MKENFINEKMDRCLFLTIFLLLLSFFLVLSWMIDQMLLSIFDLTIDLDGRVASRAELGFQQRRSKFTIRIFNHLNIMCINKYGTNFR